MTKKIWIITSLVISVLVLIYLLLDYFGFIRYFLLHQRSSEFYISSYSVLEKSEPETRVVISFTVPANELSTIKPFLNSLLDQDTRVDDIALNIPYKNINKVPPEWKKFLSIYGQSKSYGALEALIPTLLREQDAETKIIVVEPFYVYNETFISEMIEKSKERKNSIIYAKKGNIICAALVKPLFFDESITTQNGDCFSCLQKWPIQQTTIHLHNTYSSIRRK